MKKELQEELLDYFDENEVEALPVLMQEILAEFQKLRTETAKFQHALNSAVQAGVAMEDGWREAERERDLYRDLAKRLYQTEPCNLDHHGGCQEHGWLEPGPGEECPDGRAQRLFAKKEE